ncbi:NDP-hexose 23-dehydratase OS=Tsukamurella paurometabola (strain ATCC 8368 / DSM / CCUG 35730/ CIP 100753 / JCM 10117 / KCTC 9821 / NBRC 16120 / NCIMB 702349/ NCTC 13040) OX=521096 GN=Tpau_3481 PE=4 SV=1 [Tsukamurella paurometabola]|uniref:NDP-hexose 23-dehydratase n=1 Tax=Tsukamurella paurometabola (strain ATCC 8368 / DSM 20162 / CCUG 35730 / CIP 100753 / JCM 10117 / KCTC 9821 / NBRC 16120 / NCIMB 702349 / NCTC 13040) TaxID=521096 RepID=D5UX43_TSUPD|nr:NDP-hexose 23-dehydratase [Tsukamurella paurometabola DSM 20162]SUP38258.1 NDP-hexose 2,3-dehydratase [Tsukamurella paurometabola]
MKGWNFDPGTGNLGHTSGKFFTVEGLAVSVESDAPVPRWSQPIINQPEIGILGIIIKEFDGVLHCLMQAKMEPGNCNGVQLSPTVQATRSNYTRVHGGNAVPYLEYFRQPHGHRVIADVLQSEQGSWFYQKRNRNVVVEVTDDVPLLEDFCWLTIGQLHSLLLVDDLVNMDSRTVLSCLPFSGNGLSSMYPLAVGAFDAALARSSSKDRGAIHTTAEILSWVTESRSRAEVSAVRMNLDDVVDWERSDDRISHTSGAFFDVMAVEVEVQRREVSGWTQPMIDPVGTGIIAFLVRDVADVLHVLVNARTEPGYLDVSELAPTVQFTPENYAHLPAEALPPYADAVLAAPPERIRFDTVLSEEGGRFYRARNRYLLVEAPEDLEPAAGEDFRWMTLHQLDDLIRHSHYVNVQARTLVACLYSLWGASNRTPVDRSAS